MTEQTRSSFGGVQNFSGGRVLLYVFLPPYVVHPLYHGPTLYKAEGVRIHEKRNAIARRDRV